MREPKGPASGKPIIAGPAIPSDVVVNRPWHIGEIYRRGTLMPDCDANHVYWIGLVKESGNLQSQYGWRWLDGTRYSWRDWYNDDQPDGDYGVAYMYTTIGWGDHRRGYESRFICTKKKQGIND